MKWIEDLGMTLQRRMLKNDRFTIIANDCWGAEVYRNFNLAYRTPFVGLFVMAPCYLKLLKNLRFFMNADLTFIRQSKYDERNEERKAKNKFYPIGLLNGEIEIHFLHYHSNEEARETWDKRKLRINWDDLYIKFDSGKDASTYALLQEFDALPFKNKLCLSRENFPDIKCSVSFDNWIVDGAKMYRISLEKVNMINWLNGKGREVSVFYKIFYNVFIRKNSRFL